MKKTQGIVWAPVLLMIGSIVITGFAVYFFSQGDPEELNKNTNIAALNKENGYWGETRNANVTQNTNSISGLNSNKAGDKNTNIASEPEIQELTSQLAWEGYAGVQASIIGDRVLMGSHGGKLYEYDGKNITDLSEHLGDNATQISVQSIADNEDYWLILTAESTIRNHIFRYDGKSWQDLSEGFQAAMGEPEFPFGRKVIWAHDRWFIIAGARLVSFKDGAFTELTSLFSNIETNYSFLQIAWDGLRFRALISTNNYFSDNNSIIEYGFTETEAEILHRQNIDTPRQVASWNGEYWLIANEAGGNYFRFDGTTIIETIAPAEPGFYPLWIDSKWIIGPSYFDGQQLIPTSWPSLERAYSVDVSEKKGVITSYNDRVILFSLP